MGHILIESAGRNVEWGPNFSKCYVLHPFMFILYTSILNPITFKLSVKEF